MFFNIVTLVSDFFPTQLSILLLLWRGNSLIVVLNEFLTYQGFVHVI